MRTILVLATRNKHKFSEMAAIISGGDLDIRDLDSFSGAPEVIEGGESLVENAVKKAKSAAEYCGHWALADDTGLEVDALNGAPGVYSARYAGPGCSYEDNNTKLLAALAGVPPERRTARFRCVVALASPGGSVLTAEGVLEGTITESRSGVHGFGYDPIFKVRGLDRTLAELSAEEKNKLSHRSSALRNALPYLRRIQDDTCCQ